MGQTLTAKKGPTLRAETRQEAVTEAILADLCWRFGESEDLQRWKGDKHVMMAVVARNGLALQFADTSLQSDKEVVLAAVSQDGIALRFADETLKADKDVVMKAVSQNGDALDFADETLQADREVVMTAVRQEGRALLLLDKALRADKEIVIAAVSQDGRALRLAAESLRSDRDVVMAAVRQTWKAFATACRELQCDGSFVHTLMDVLPMGQIMVIQVAVLSGKSCCCLFEVELATLQQLRERSAWLLGLDEIAVRDRGELLLGSTGVRLGSDDALRGLGLGVHELQLIVRST